MKTFAEFDIDGLPTAFYNEDVHGALIQPVFKIPEPTEDDPEPKPILVGEEANPDCKIPSGLVEITYDQWLEFINNYGRRKWENGEVVPYEPPVIIYIPQSISDRQFFQQLAVEGIITEDEALASNRGIIPATLLVLIEQMPDDDQFAAKMIVSGATVYERNNQLTINIGHAAGKTDDQIDLFFINAAKL